MKRSIEVNSKAEANEINAGLRNVKLKAITRITGILSEFNEEDQKWIIDRTIELAGLDV